VSPARLLTPHAFGWYNASIPTDIALPARTDMMLSAALRVPVSNTCGTLIDIGV